MEHPYIPDDLEAFEAVNNGIAEQNARFELTAQITDEEFRTIAVDGVSTEQHECVELRLELSEKFDYATIFAHWETVLEVKNQIQMNIESLQASKAEIAAQAELSLSIAPNSAQEIQKLTDSKVGAFDTEITELETSIDLLREKELGFVAVCQPWTIPLASRTEETISQPEDLTVEEAAEPNLIVTETGIEEAQLKRVLWSVFDCASKADETGVRLEEMRKVVPELAELSEDDYKYFKNNFAEMRSNIVEMLDGMGYRVAWTTSGRTRGTRYHVRELTKPSTSLQLRPTETTPQVVQITNPTPEHEPAEINTPDDLDSPEQEPEEISLDSSNATSEITEEAASDLPPTENEMQVQELEEDLERKGTPTFHMLKNVTGASHTTGVSAVVEISADDIVKHLNIKKDPQFVKEVKKWIHWLVEHPRTPASHKLRSFKGVRLSSGTEVVPLYRFSPKDAIGLPVPKSYIRHRVVYALVNNVPAVLDVLDHDSFDRKYK